MSFAGSYDDMVVILKQNTVQKHRPYWYCEDVVSGKIVSENTNRNLCIQEASARGYDVRLQDRTTPRGALKNPNNLKLVRSDFVR